MSNAKIVYILAVLFPQRKVGLFNMQQKKCNQIYIYTVKQNSMASAQASSDCQV